jgi:hypothetical protein
MQLLNLYRNLSRPNTELGSSTFQVVPIPGFERHRIGKDGTGAPALLIHIGDEGGQVPGPVALHHVTVQHRLRCSLLTFEGAAQDEFTVIRCVSGDRALREYFIRISEATVQQLGASPTRGQVTRALEKLTELFRAFELPSRKTAQGLWAELVLIAIANDPATLITAWHADPDEGYDFSDGRTRLEVKSFSQQARVHSFSLRQARPGNGIDVVVASIRAERSGGGATIADVLALIQARGLSTEALFKVQDIVARSLGDTAVTALALAFDLERARGSLLFFESASVPSVDPLLPAGVLNVRFDALLDEEGALTTEAFATRADLFAAATPT